MCAHINLAYLTAQKSRKTAAELREVLPLSLATRSRLQARLVLLSQCRSDDAKFCREAKTSQERSAPLPACSDAYLRNGIRSRLCRLSKRLSNQA